MMRGVCHKPWAVRNVVERRGNTRRCGVQVPVDDSRFLLHLNLWQLQQFHLKLGWYDVILRLSAGTHAALARHPVRTHVNGGGIHIHIRTHRPADCWWRSAGASAPDFYGLKGLTYKHRNFAIMIRSC